MKMKNEVNNTRARSKTQIRPEDEEKTKEEWIDEKDWFESLLNLEADNAKIVQLETEPVVAYCSSVVPVAKL
jgi:hypothetical protein